MPQISVTLSANAGVALNIGGRRIWVDALHDQKMDGFSTLTPQLQRDMMVCQAFAHPEYICFTHEHTDHYSAELTAVARQLWPNAKVLMPGDSVEGIRFVRLPHEGEQYACVEHYGLIISLNGCNVLISGDCEVASPALSKAIAGVPIHLALLNFPWATLRKGREFLLEHFRNSHIILYHLPFEADDRNGYRRSAKHAVDTFSEIGDMRLLWDPLQTENINI